jgi:hypothetical protein
MWCERVSLRKQRRGDNVLVHQKVESSAAKLAHWEGILHGHSVASCDEGFSHIAKVGMEGSRPSLRGRSAKAFRKLFQVHNAWFENTSIYRSRIIYQRSHPFELYVSKFI